MSGRLHGQERRHLSCALSAFLSTTTYNQIPGGLYLQMPVYPEPPGGTWLLWGPHPRSVTRTDVDVAGAIADRLAGGGWSRLGAGGGTLAVTWLVLVGDHRRASRVVRSSTVARRERRRPRAVVDGPRAVVNGARAEHDGTRAVVDGT